MSTRVDISLSFRGGSKRECQFELTFRKPGDQLLELAPMDLPIHPTP